MINYYMLKVKDWFDYLSKHKENSTYTTYRSLMNKYAEFKSKPVEELTIRDFNPLDVENFVADKPPRSANTFIACVKSFAKWVRRNEVITDVNELILLDNAVRQIEAIEFKKVPKKGSITITLDQLEKLLKVVQEDDILYAATIVHAFTGARPIELANKFNIKRINPNNAEIENAIDFIQDILTLVTAKSNRTRFRILPYPDAIEDSIKIWVEFVNTTLKDYKYPDEWFTKNIKHYAERLGLKITAKTFRRLVETHFSKINIGEWMVKYWLGHSEGISGEYRDKTKLIKDIYNGIVENHYIYDVL